MEDRKLLSAREIGECIPIYAASVLLLGQQGRELVETLHSRKCKVVSAAIGQHAAMPQGVFDCAVFGPSPLDACNAALPALAQLVSVHGTIVIVVELASPGTEVPHEFQETLAEQDLILRNVYPYEGEASELALVLVRSSYDPIQHARDFEASGHPMRALSVLSSIFDMISLTDAQRARLCLERLRIFCGAALSSSRDGANSPYLSRAKKEFQIAIHTLPRCHSAYRMQAEIWRHYGREDLGVRLLRSVCHVEADTETQTLLESMRPAAPPAAPEDDVPEWTGSRRKPRILVITHDQSDYGMDSLYDGLCTVLGAENVLEYPWKGTLHGQTPEAALNYPCVFDYPGEPLSPSSIEEQLRDGRFDIILHADVVQCTHRDVVRRFLDAAPDIPVAVYDPWDDVDLYLPAVLRYLGRERVTAYFKREMLEGFDYGPDAYPLPFGYPDRLVPAEVSTQREGNLFWAGKRLFGTRSLYLDHLASLLGQGLEKTYSQEEYRVAISRSRIGLSLFGYGYDTVRYWELPAHGTMLLAEKPPIRIPHDFIDGESAVHFEDLPELEHKLAYYLDHPGEADAIARAGRNHFLRYHMGSTRARQFLGRMEQLAPW
ncbi:MAG: glycosyltransferase family 1 protein [Candidatus Hydrogenedentes bacterium]|nr:glycosyltransferase family 1 protein [Candidatus Hydrogenedentota bacterium]